MAEQFGNIFSGLSGVFWQMTARQKAELLMITILTITALVLVAWWAGQTEYEVIFYDMAASDVGSIVNKLKEKDISYKIDQGGTRILVPTKMVQELRIDFAQQGFPESGLVGYEIFDQSNLGMSNFVQKINYRRALEGELARTLIHMTEIKNARVHIVIPEEKLFKEDKQSPSAAVILTLARSNSLSQSQIKGVARLIASSVEGLRSDQITIVDSHGNVLSKGEESGELLASTGNQLEIQMAVETALMKKSQAMLESVVGVNNSIVRVNVELDFESIQKTSESYDPDGQVIRSEQFTTTASTATDTSQSSKETSTTKYEINRTVETVMNSGGGIKRMTIAVLVNGKYVEYDDPDGGEKPVIKYEPRTPKEITNLTNIVKTAVGFDEERGDKIEVIGMQFENTGLLANLETSEDDGFQLDYMNLAKNAGMVLVALAALFILRSMSKKAGPIRMTSSGQSNYASLSAANVGTIALPNESDLPKLGESVLPEAMERTKMHNQIERYSTEKSSEATSLLRSWLLED